MSNYRFLNGDAPRSPSYGVYISQLIRLREYVLMLMTSTTDFEVIKTRLSIP